MKRVTIILLSVALMCGLSAGLSGEERNDRDYRYGHVTRSHHENWRRHDRDRRDYRRYDDQRCYHDNRYDKSVWREMRKYQEKIARLQYKIREYERKMYYSGRRGHYMHKIARLAREIERLEWKITSLRRYLRG